MRKRYYTFRLGKQSFRIYKTTPHGWYARAKIFQRWPKVVAPDKNAGGGAVIVEPTKREMQDYLRYAYGFVK